MGKMKKEFDVEIISKDCCSILRYNGNEETVEIPQTIEKDGKTYIVTEIADEAFTEENYECTKVILPETIISIGKKAFSGYNHLHEINIPEKVEHIGDEAFTNTCVELGCLCSDNGTKMIGWFSARLQEEVIRVPEGVVEIRPFAFKSVMFVHKIILPKSLKVIAENAFKDCYVNEINLPEGLTEIGESAFEHCYQLKSINIPSGVQEIKKETFSSCDKLEKVTFPSGLKAIGEGAFSCCQSLISVKLPKGTEVGNYAFNETTHIVYVDTDAGAAKIEEGAIIDSEKLFVILAPISLKESKGTPLVGEDLSQGNNLFLFHSFDDARDYMVSNDFENYGGCYPIGQFDPSNKYTSISNIFKSALKFNVTHFLLDGRKLGDIKEYLEKNGGCDGEIYNNFNEELEGLADTLGKAFSQIKSPFSYFKVLNFTFPYEITKERIQELEDQVYKNTEGWQKLDNVVADNTYYENCFMLWVLSIRAVSGQIPEHVFEAFLQLYANAIWYRIAIQDVRLYKLVNKETHDMLCTFPNGTPKGRTIVISYTDMNRNIFPYCNFEFEQIQLSDLSAILEEDEDIMGVTLTDTYGTQAFIGKPAWLSHDNS